jgi:hypothetical protein
MRIASKIIKRDRATPFDGDDKMGEGYCACLSIHASASCID